jgi:transcriptional regulator with XRE-family HTH domain
MEPPEATTSDPNALFGRRLRQAREIARLTQEELAALAGLSAKAVGALERGERRHPYPSTVRALAAALRLTEEEYALLADAVPPRGGVIHAVPRSLHYSLPTPRTSFVGRTADVGTARTLLLNEAVPLLTLTGTGGVGKTRLALAIAHGVVAAFPNGVVFVDLAPLRDPDLVLTAIAQALHVRQGRGPVLDRCPDCLPSFPPAPPHPRQCRAPAAGGGPGHNPSGVLSLTADPGHEPGTAAGSRRTAPAGSTLSST